MIIETIEKTKKNSISECRNIKLSDHQHPKDKNKYFFTTNTLSIILEIEKQFTHLEFKQMQRELSSLDI